MLRDQLSKYECARIIGIRSAQIAMSAPILVEVPPRLQNKLMFIAALELKRGVLDIKIQRPLPQNSFYEVCVKDMTVPDDIDTLIDMYMNTADHDSLRTPMSVLEKRER